MESEVLASPWGSATVVDVGIGVGLGGVVGQGMGVASGSAEN